MKKINLFTTCVFALFVLNTNANIFNTISTGTNDGVKDSVKEAVKSLFTIAIVNPIVNPIKNLLPCGKSEKIQKNTAEIITLSEQIKKLKDSGANRKYIAFLQAQLKKKIQDSLDSSPKK